MTSVWHDLRYSVRLLGRHRRFSVIAVVTLGLAIGASTAMFSVIDAALLHPLPYPDPEQLVDVVVQESSGDRISQVGPSLAEVREWRSASGVIAETCVFRFGFNPEIVDTGEFERVSALYFSEGCTALYGVTPIAGRSIEVDDTRIGARPVVMLGWQYWQRRFGGTPDAVGRTIGLAEGPATIVGVMPKGFQPGVGIFRALRARTAADVDRRGRGTDTIARLRADVTLADAARVLSSIATAGTPATRGVRVVSLYDETTQWYRKTIRTLAGAVAMILLLACVNVAGLMLARGQARLPELAVRASLGAGRARLVRQLLTESALIAIAAAALGLGLARMSLDVLVALIPVSLPPDAPASINGNVMLFTVVAAMLVALAFGLAPAIRLSRGGLDAFARANRRHGSALSRRNGQVLIAIEVALAVVLLAGAGVLIRSFARLVSTELGFDRERVVAMEVVPADRTPEILSTYYPELLRAIRQLPGVQHAGAADQLPLIGGSTMTTASAGGPPEMVEHAQILPGYFETLGVPLLAGRGPTDTDAGHPVVVLSQAAAKKLFADGTALGQRVVVNRDSREVIGIVGDVHHWGAGTRSSRPKVYVPFGSTNAIPMTMVIRMRPGTTLPVDQLRSAATAIGPRVFVENFRPGSEWLRKNTMRARHRTLLFTLLGGFGVLLALVGIFSMTAYAVANRTQELGVRLALGARANQVVRLVLRDAAWPTAVGVILGLFAAALATRVVASFLFNTTATDPWTFATVALALFGTGCLAAWIPARHVARIDPVIALRAE